MLPQDGSQGFQYHFPTRVVFGPGRLAQLPSLVEEVGGADARVLLVTGRRSLKEQGVLDRVREALGPGRVVPFDGVPPNPPPAVVGVDGQRADIRSAGAAPWTWPRRWPP